MCNILVGPFPWPLFGDIVALRKGANSKRLFEGYVWDRIKEFGGKERVVEAFFAGILTVDLFFSRSKIYIVLYDIIIGYRMVFADRIDYMESFHIDRSTWSKRGVRDQKVNYLFFFRNCFFWLINEILTSPYTHEIYFLLLCFKFH